MEKTFIRRGCTCNSYKAAEGASPSFLISHTHFHSSRAAVNKNTRIVIFTVQLLSQLSNGPRVYAKQK